MKKIILALLILVSAFQSKSQDTSRTYIDKLVAMKYSKIQETISLVESSKANPNTSTNDFIEMMDSKFTKYPWYFDTHGKHALNLQDSIKLIMGFDFSDKSMFKEVQFSLEGYENFPPRINQISCTWIISEEGGTTQHAYNIKRDGTNYEKVISYGLRNSSKESSIKVCVLIELVDENGFVKDITKCKRVYYHSLY